MTARERDAEIYIERDAEISKRWGVTARERDAEIYREREMQKYRRDGE